MTSRTFAESGEGQVLLEKCNFLGKMPREVLELTEAEDEFITRALEKRYKNGRLPDKP
jgi:hypothetical protein